MNMLKLLHHLFKPSLDRLNMNAAHSGPDAFWARFRTTERIWIKIARSYGEGTNLEIDRVDHRHRLLRGQFPPGYAAIVAYPGQSGKRALPCLVGSRRHFVNRHGLMNSRRVDFQHFQIIRAIELVMNDPRRLQDTITGLERLLSLAFIYELNPAFQHIEHLKVAEMLMQTSGVQIMRTSIFLDADDMGSKLPMRGRFNAEVAVFHKAA